MQDLHGRRVAITGATGALGAALVETFLASGARVVAVARLKTRLDELRASLRQHERLDVAECDLADPDGVDALFASLTGEEGLDAVVHCAGAFVHGDLIDVGSRDVARVVRSNLLASALVARAALVDMCARGRGSVVLVAADAALGPAPGMSAYAAAKAGVTHLVSSVAEELHGRGPTIHALLPGILDTPGNRLAMPDADPAGWVAMSTIARTAVYLAIPEGDGVNGALLRLPGR